MYHSILHLQHFARTASVLIWFVSAPMFLFSQAWIDSVCTLTEFNPNKHIVWMNQLPGDTDRLYQLGPNSASIEFYSDSTARITMRVQNRSDSTRQWDVEVWIVARMDYNAWTALGRGAKTGGGTTNDSTWIFYEMDDSRSRMYGVPGTYYAGDTLLLHHFPVSKEFGFQIGVGANDQNGDYGISGWFSYSGSYSGRGDINANLACTQNPPCFAEIDTAYAECVNDSAFSVLVTFSGNDTLYTVTDQNGNGPGQVPPGSYLLGPYASGTYASVFVDAVNGDSCSAMIDSLTAICEPVNFCDVMIDTAFAQCASDTSFEFVVTFSGVGTSFAIYDDQGSAPMIVNQPGTYVFGSYFNSVEAFIFVEESGLDSCLDFYGPLTADCTPVALCDLVLDTVYTECASDSSFRMVVGFSGSGSQFQIYDNQGTTPVLGLAEGVYVFGEYLNGTPVSLTLLDFGIFNCFLTTPILTDSCTAPDSTDSLWGNFQATAAGEEIFLTWKSLDEREVYQYIMERSEDSLSYEVIGLRPRSGNPDGLAHYEMLDATAKKGTIYFYRLCMVDKDGKRSFSQVRKAQMEAARVGTIGLMYPQPVQTESQLPVVAAREGASLDILIVDAAGHVWAEYSQSLRKGSQDILLTWEGLPPGLYFLRAVIDNQEVSAQRVLLW